MKNATLGKGCALGCAGLAVILGLLLLVGYLARKNMTPAERAAEQAAQEAALKADRAKDDAPVDALLAKLHDMQTRLPSPEAMQEQLCPAFGGDRVAYLAMDRAFLEQFTGHGFVAGAAPDPHLWYRGTWADDVQGALVPPAYTQHRDNGALLLLEKEFEHVPYVAVFEPLEQHWPILNADGKTFQAGTFQGWVILVDPKTLTPLGQTKFASQNGEKVTSLRVGLGGELVGPTLKTALENDFTDRFWKAAAAAIARICHHDDPGVFVSHQESFPSGL
jgi:hypothetical protein